MTSGALEWRRLVHIGQSGLPWCSRRVLSVPDAEVGIAREASWCRCFMMCSCLAAKPFHVGVDVDGLAYPCTILWSAANRRGDGTSCQVPPCPIV
jgi:hypothetical protein